MPTKHTRAQPTDAYGTIEFQGGAHPTKAQVSLKHTKNLFTLKRFYCILRISQEFILRKFNKSKFFWPFLVCTIIIRDPSRVIGATVYQRMEFRIAQAADYGAGRKSKFWATAQIKKGTYDNIHPQRWSENNV